MEEKRRQKAPPTTMRLTWTAKRMIDLLTIKLGLSNSGIIELAVRRLAEAENIVEHINGEQS